MTVPEMPLNVPCCYYRPRTKYEEGNVFTLFVRPRVWGGGGEEGTSSLFSGPRSLLGDGMGGGEGGVE